MLKFLAHNDSKLSDIDEWLNDILMTNETGSYETSLNILKQIEERDGIGYIAHINSSNIFKRESSGSGAYKRKIFNSKSALVVYSFNESLNTSV